jgi:hypothetical protein
MAIQAVSLQLIAQFAAKLPKPCRMLSLSYPDMIVTEAKLAEICGAQAMQSVTFRDDSDTILRWHGLEGKLARVAETSSVLKALGLEVEYVDIVASRGFEIELDLNQPAPEHLHARYDVVFDGGTLEHCFNVGQVMRNILAFTKVGGYVLHVNPLNFYNHGFFNFNPTFYHDWYARSGNKIVSPLYGMFGPVLEPKVVALDPLKGFSGAPERTALVVAAQRVSAAQPDWPMQSKYVNNPQLRG